MAKRLLLPRSQAVGLDGRPLAGAKLYTYATGTSTPKAVYTDSGLTVAHANPVIADSAGRFPAMFLASGDYKTELRDSADTVIATDDPVEGDSAAATTEVATAAQAARRNLFINPAMQISQEFGTSNTDCTTGNNYTLDQWVGALSSTPGGTLRVAQVASVTPGGSPFRLRATVQATDASLAAGDFYAVWQHIEGSRSAAVRFGSASARQVLIRLGVRSSIAGTFGVQIRNSASNRSWVGLLTIAAGEINTDLVRTFTLTGDTAGTWLTGVNTIGMTVGVCLASGATAQGVTGWQAGSILTTSGQTNFMGTGSATFDLFDCGLYVDTAAAGVFPPFELPDHADALAECQRHLYVTESAIPVGGTMRSGIGSSTYVRSAFPRRMMITPSAPGSPTFSGGSNNASQAVNNIGPDGFTVQVTATGSADGGFGVTLSSGCTFKARL